MLRVKIEKSGCIHSYSFVCWCFRSIRLEDSSEEEDSSNEAEVEIDEETIIKYYFQRGFSYEEIIHFLAKRHDHEISYSTLLRRLKTYGL